MGTYLISDTHFGHRNIIAYENRPFENVDEMNKKLINNWNKVVSNGDRVYMLGDVSMGLNKEKLTEVLGQLNGEICLVMGNHDTKPSGYGFSWFKNTGRFWHVSPFPIIIEDYLILSHQPLYLEKKSPYANIYGHVHGDVRYRNFTSNTACVCVERINYTPISLDEVIQGMRDAEDY